MWKKFDTQTCQNIRAQTKGGPTDIVTPINRLIGVCGSITTQYSDVSDQSSPFHI